MKKFISRFHYLSQDLPNRSHTEQVLTACEAGANWIQYRCLSKSDKDLISEINQIAMICDDWGATLIITNHYHLLDKFDAQGVHMENMDANLGKIRSIITEEKTLGASAISFTDIKRIAHEGAADYIGCGPFSFTQTKINDYPLLGIEGYRAILTEMEQANIKVPILAVGGIKIEDAAALQQEGVYGIAVSSAVNVAEDPKSAIKEFRKYFA